TPRRQRPQAVTPTRFRLFPFRSPLLRESIFLSLPPATKMFHFADLPPPTLCVQVGVPAHYHGWVSPFGNPRIKAWSAAPRGLSQPPTSFIGSRCQGIHRVPLFTWPQRCSRPLCSSQGAGGHRGDSPRSLTRVPFGDQGGRTCGAEGSILRSLRTQQRAYGRRR